MRYFITYETKNGIRKTMRYKTEEDYKSELALFKRFGYKIIAHGKM